MRLRGLISILAVLVSVSPIAFGQMSGTGPFPADSSDQKKKMPLSEAAVLAIQAEDLLREYEFEKALDICRKAMETCRDSLLRISIEQLSNCCENGVKLADFCHRPVVVAREKFSREDFFLYYPLPDKAWRPSPNILDSLGGNWQSKALYWPEGREEIFFSAVDTAGVRNLYATHFADTAWTKPEKLPFSSSESDVYPLVQGDKLYFSSKGLYGVGGYDLYVTSRDKKTGEWSLPENMGFPYSSPADDFLYMDTRDGRYSIFASNRDCQEDSICVYVLEYDSMPVHGPVRDVAELRTIAALEPSVGRNKINNSSALREERKADEKTAVYMSRMAEVRKLQENLTAYRQALEEKRTMYASADAIGKKALQEEIMADEMRLPAMGEELAKATRELQALEMEFLTKGVVFDRAAVEEESDKEVVGVDKAYTFTRKNPGDRIELKFVSDPVIVEPEPVKPVKKKKR